MCFFRAIRAFEESPNNLRDFEHAQREDEEEKNPIRPRSNERSVEWGEEKALLEAKIKAKKGKYFF